MSRPFNFMRLTRCLFSAVVGACAALASVVVVAAPTPAAALGALPSASVYQLDVPLVDQDGHAFAFRDRRGRAQLVSMFYTSCQLVCPRLIDTMRETAKQFSTEERDRLEMLVLTFDPVRDDVLVLKGVANKRALDPAHWTLARPSVRDARKLAAALGIRYRALPDGDFNHTTTLILLDQEGQIVTRTNTLGAVDAAFVDQVRKTIHDVPELGAIR